MRKAQLAQLPADGRRSERRLVNIAASLRDSGATLQDAEVLDLSLEGFKAQTELALATGDQVVLKLPGHEAFRAAVVWVDGRVAGFQFATPLHPATLGLLTSSTRKPMVRNHFGPNALKRR